MRRVLTLVLFLLLAAPAAAQNGQIVASSGGYDLYARHGKGDRVCINVLGPGGYSAEARCMAPLSPFQPAQAYTYRAGAPVALAVPATVGRVTAGGTSADATTVAGYSARFVLLSGADPDELLRLYDDSGALVGAARQTAAFERNDDGKRVFRARSVTLRVSRGYELEPTPLKFDRTVPETCLSIQSEHSGTQSCTLDRDLRHLGLAVEPGCAPARAVLFGLVAPSVHRVQVVLGSGRRVTLGTRALPGSPARLLAASVPRGEAVRSARAGGRRARIGAAPSGFPCDEESNSFSSYGLDYITTGGTPVAEPVTVAEAGGRALRVADGSGLSLCAGLAKLSCSTPPVDSSYPFFRRRGQLLFAVLARDVATVDVRLADGSTLSPATTDGPAYTGRYAGRVRFLAVQLPAGARVTRAVPRAADGRRLGSVSLDVGGTTTVSRRRVEPGLTLVRYRTVSAEDGTDTETCLLPRRTHAPQYASGLGGLCSSFTHFGVVARVSASCTPRRTVLFGNLPKRASSVRLELADGRLVRPRVRRFAGLGRVWTEVLPRDATVKALRYRGQLGRRSFRVLPAARECGYDNELDVF